CGNRQPKARGSRVAGRFKPVALGGGGRGAALASAIRLTPSPCRKVVGYSPHRPCWAGSFLNPREGLVSCRDVSHFSWLSFSVWHPCWRKLPRRSRFSSSRE